MWPGVGESSEAVFLLRDMLALPRGRVQGADEPDKSCSFICLSASLVAAENGSESPNGEYVPLWSGAFQQGPASAHPGRHDCTPFLGEAFYLITTPLLQSKDSLQSPMLSAGREKGDPEAKAEVQIRFKQPQTLSPRPH